MCIRWAFFHRLQSRAKMYQLLTIPFIRLEIMPEMKTEKEIQTTKAHRNISYVEARKLIVPQLIQIYAQAPNLSIVTTTAQTDENITKIEYLPLKLLQPLIPIPKPTMSSKILAVTKSSTTTQENFVPSTSSVPVTSSSESESPIPLIDTAPATSNSLPTSAASSSSNKALYSSTVSVFTSLPAETCPIVETSTTISNTTLSTSQAAKQTLKSRRKKRPNRSNNPK
ncbi:uncharacterized protein TNCV_3065501 [Trichonephila clavipes]|uniref:Uncharacterized protein n=1 Tax=Trichonephila clavipes TaxID=2585209 RepID=A0A8X6RZ75_TRICX|nr:uncharacterized protein TNCV_3065501 [Trichonephila clavipes]